MGFDSFPLLARKQPGGLSTAASLVQANEAEERLPAGLFQGARQLSERARFGRHVGMPILSPWAERRPEDRNRVR